jgi:hypothetical protein
MFLHRVLDAINGKTRDVVNGPKECIEEFKRLTAQAELFDFSQLHLEPSPDHAHSFKLPRLTDDEIEFWEQGLIPLPAPVCWFEFKFETTSGILVRQFGNDIQATQVDFGYDGISNNECVIDCIWTTAVKNPPRKMVKNEAYLEFDCLNKPFMKRLLSTLSTEQLGLYYAAPYHLAKYLILMLNSKTTEVYRKNIDDRLNKAREKRGATKIRSHFVVTIVPEKFKSINKNADGTHASPRLHWRRSHIRVMNDKKVLVSRHLVGRRELGEVTHEYVVKSKSPYKS